MAVIDDHIWVLYVSAAVVVLLCLVGCACYCTRKDKIRRRKGMDSAGGTGGGVYFISGQGPDNNHDLRRGGTIFAADIL